MTDISKCVEPNYGEGEGMSYLVYNPKALTIKSFIDGLPYSPMKGADLFGVKILVSKKVPEDEVWICGREEAMKLVNLEVK